MYYKLFFAKNDVFSYLLKLKSRPSVRLSVRNANTLLGLPVSTHQVSNT